MSAAEMFGAVAAVTEGLGADVIDADDIGAYAVELAVRGWAMLPLRGKIPAIPKAQGGNGVLDATTDLEQVTRWWAGKYARFRAYAILELQAALVDATRLHQLPKAEPLIDGILTRDSLSWLHGKPGHAKSFVALDWACCVATDRQWRGWPTYGGNVLFVVAEGAHGMEERRAAWEQVNGTTVGEGRLVFLPVAVQFLAALDIAALTMLAEELDPALIVVDTQARVTVGAEENSSRDMGMFVAAADTLRIATGACVLVVHHEARQGDTLLRTPDVVMSHQALIRAGLASCGAAYYLLDPDIDMCERVRRGMNLTLRSLAEQQNLVRAIDPDSAGRIAARIESIRRTAKTLGYGYTGGSRQLRRQNFSPGSGYLHRRTVTMPTPKSRKTRSSNASAHTESWVVTQLPYPSCATGRRLLPMVESGRGSG